MAQDTPQRVVITDVAISISAWMEILVKIAVAMIPAAIVIALLYLILGAIFGGLLASMVRL